MSKTAILAIRIIGDASNAQKSMEGLDKSTSKSISMLDKASIAAGAVAIGMIAMGKKLETAGETMSTSNGKIEQITKSMGLFENEADTVTKRMIKQAEAMAKNTGIDPNVIKQGQATLATFSEVAKTADQMGGAFDRATVLATDLEAAGLSSVEGAAVMLGKALQDPIQGVSALTRVGVSFTDAEKEKIKALQESGDMLGAQEIVLQSLETQVGGTAVATANASDQMKVAWQLQQEELGMKLLPLFDKFRQAGLKAAEWMSEHQDIVIGVAGAIGTLAVAVLTINAAMKIFTAIQALQTIAQLASNAAWLASPITWIVLAIIAAIAAVVAATIWVIKNWDDLKAAAERVFQAVIDKVGEVANWFKEQFDKIASWFNGLVQGFKDGFESVKNAIKSVLNLLGELLSKAVPGWVKNLVGMKSVEIGFGAPPPMPQPVNTQTSIPVLPQYHAERFFDNGSARLFAPAVNHSNTINVEFSGLVTDEEATARAIRRILKKSDALNGRAFAAGRA